MAVSETEDKQEQIREYARQQARKYPELSAAKKQQIANALRPAAQSLRVTR